MWRYCLARLLKNGNGDLPFHAGEVLEKPIEGVPALKVGKQILDRHPSAGEHRDTALNLGVDRDESVTHSTAIIRRPPAMVPNVKGERRAAPTPASETP